MSELDHSTLFRESEILYENFKKINDQLAETYLAAETINGTFRDIIYVEFDYPNPEPWQEAIVLLTFGAYQSWLMAYINVCSGLSDISNILLRRAIEFTCFAAKVKENNERADLWFNRSKSLENRKNFSNIFSVPQRYFSNKYSYLHPLLVLHDKASEYAVHANFEALIKKIDRDENDHIVTLSIHDVSDNQLVSIGMVLVSGYKILETIITLFHNEFINSDSINSRFEIIKEMIRKARLSIAELDYDGNIPFDVLVDINNETNMDLAEFVKILKQKYK